MSEKKRIYYFDMAKGIGILLVVMGHLEYISMELRYFIVSFHMPMFFIISGMLMYLSGEEKKDAPTFIKGKLVRIGLPYLSYSILFLIIEVATLLIKHIGSVEEILEDAYLSLCLYGISVLWFLPAMFFGLLIFWFLRRKLSHRATIITMVLLTVVMYYANLGLTILNWFYGLDFFYKHLQSFLAMIVRSFFAASFLAVGYYMMLIWNKLVEKATQTGAVSANPAAGLMKLLKYAGLPICLLLLGSIAYLSQVNGAVDLHFLIFQNPLIYLFNAIAGSLSVIVICGYLERFAKTIPCRILCYYGRNSLIIMATHINSYVMYCAIIFSLYMSQFITRAKNYIFCGMILSIVFLAEIVIIELINRFFPFFAGRIGKAK